MKPCNNIKLRMPAYLYTKPKLNKYKEFVCRLENDERIRNM